MNHNPEGPSLDELNAALWNSLGTAGFPLQRQKHHAKVRHAANLLLGYLRTFDPAAAIPPQKRLNQHKSIVADPGCTVRADELEKFNNPHCSAKSRIHAQADCRGAGLARHIWCQSCDFYYLQQEPQAPYVLITVSGGVADIAQCKGKVDVDIFDWDDMKEKIESGFSEILSDGELENLKKYDEPLYTKYVDNCAVREAEERGISDTVRSRADVIEQLLLADESKVITELKRRGWDIEQTLQGTLGNGQKPAGYNKL